MGTRFRIIQGGKLDVTKTAASDSAIKPAQRIRYKTPDLFSRTDNSKPSTTRYWIKPDRFDREFIWGMLLAPLAMFYGVWSWTGQRAELGNAAVAAVALFASDTESAAFGFCHSGGGINCVVDGDTLYYQGTKIRIADIDTPETHPPRCAEEARLGEAATRRLHALVNAGPFSLQSIDRDEDSYGRKLRLITRGGSSIGNDLVGQGLARWYEGGRQGWC
ncbi:MAG: thermonuclease family protein [Sphingorhabdus sp.]